MTSPPSPTFPDFAITATSTVPVANNIGSVTQPESSFEAWSLASADSFVDGLQGSTKPVGLLVPTTIADTYSLPLKVTGHCWFPVEWPRGPSTCQLKGTLQGNLNAPIIIVSETWDITLPTTNPQVPILLPLDLKAFTIPAPFVKNVCPIPFRIAGDFQWECVNTKDQAAHALKLEKSTRLELNWLLGPAASGDGQIAISAMRSGTNLDGVYPISLLRLFLPQPAEFVAVSQFDQVHLQWWMSNCLKKVPTSRFIYDTIVGKSGFGAGCCGGSFRFDEFQRVALPANPPSTAPPTLINSFDLASLVQLACSLLVDQDGDEQLNSKWVCKSPFGVQKSGMPFGIMDKTVPAVSWPLGVNNPYFSGIDGAKPYESDVTKVKSANARAWIEATFPGNRTYVIDWACAVPRIDSGKLEPEDGSRDRKTFAQSHIAEPNPNLSNYYETDALSNGSCFRNDEFGSQQSGFPKGIARVGLYNLRGLNEPRRGQVPAPYIPIPPRLRYSIVNLIASGKNSTAQRWLYNDASLKALNIAPVVAPVGVGLVYNNPQPNDVFFTTLRVVSGASMASYTFNGLAVNNGETGSLALTISVLNDFFNAYEAMAFALSTYERDVTEIAAPPTGSAGRLFIGHYSLQTPRSLLWVRGNLFVELTIQSLSKPDADAGLAVVAAAQRLDSYLARHSVAGSQIRRPQLHFTDANAPPTATVVGNQSIRVQLDADDIVLARVMSVSFDRSQLLVHGDFDVANWMHTFWVLGRSGAAGGIDRKTKVTIAGAHVDTFHPGQVKFEVTVAGLKTADGTDGAMGRGQKRKGESE